MGQSFYCHHILTTYQKRFFVLGVCPYFTRVIYLLGWFVVLAFSGQAGGLLDRIILYPHFTFPAEGTAGNRTWNFLTRPYSCFDDITFFDETT